MEKGKVSRYFDGPIAAENGRIAYFKINEESATLVVQDIFDIDKFYKEFTGEFDNLVLMKSPEITYADGGTKIVIRHYETNNENNVIEEAFVLD